MRAAGIFALAAMTAVSGCAIGDETAAAKSEVAGFRQQVLAGQFAEIYRTGSAELHAAGDEARFVALIGGFYQAMGKFRSAPEPRWRLHSDGDGCFITLRYESIFERGKAEEDFVFRLTEGKPMLASYTYTLSGVAPFGPAPASTDERT